MLTLKNKTDLERLIAEGVKESLTLDYKASPALDKADKKRDELCKDVTSFANSAGGQIVYGMEEDKHVPTKLDDGAAPEITKEWVEQVIDSRVQPRIEGLVITPIDLAKGLGFVITIPQATTRAPHQAPDKRYYKRQNFQSTPMEDYEVKDTLRRATTPDLFVTISFLKGDRARLMYASNHELSQPVYLLTRIGNRSPQPAQHILVRIGIDENIPIAGLPQIVRVLPSGDLHNGEKVTVTVSGYWPEAKFWLSECAVAAYVQGPTGCGAQLAADPSRDAPQRRRQRA